MNIDHATTIMAQTEYYKIICMISKNKATKKWLASVRVIRKDTGEYIKAGFTVFSHNKSQTANNAKQKIIDSLLPELNDLGKPPEWQSKSRQILLQCKKMRSEISDFGNCIADNALSSSNVDECWEKYAAFCKKIIKTSISLSREIETLSEQERTNLLVLTENVINDPSDAWSLEEIDSRALVFDFFLKPTELERKIYAEQKKKLLDRFNELGWS